MPGPSNYQDLVVPDEKMPSDDPRDDLPNLEESGGNPFGPDPRPGNDSDLLSDKMEFQYRFRGNLPPYYPGGNISISKPEDNDSSMEFISDRIYNLSSDDDDHASYPIEIHMEPPPNSYGVASAWKKTSRYLRDKIAICES